jgi:hypothetical protein
MSANKRVHHRETFSRNSFLTIPCTDVINRIKSSNLKNASQVRGLGRDVFVARITVVFDKLIREMNEIVAQMHV